LFLVSKMSQKFLPGSAWRLDIETVKMLAGFEKA
jgi:hypothetical protein